VVFDKKMWVIAGLNAGIGHFNEVWNSTNGATWTPVKSNDANGFTKRSKHSSVVFDDDGRGEKMWVIGGGPFHANDVWNSTNGATWTPVKSDEKNNGFSQRESHESVVFDDKMWVIAGVEVRFGLGHFSVNDVWNSTNGATWEKIKSNDSNGFSARQSFSSVVFNDGSGKKIWVIGGIDGNNDRLNDVWNSTDGKTWTPVKANNSEGFSARSGHTSVVFDNKMWVIGGFDGTLKDDVWSSTNGVTWNEETDNPRFTGRYNHTSVMFKNKIWFMAGSDSLRNTSKNDVWYMVKD
jgi:dihydrofolate reductase